MKISKMIKYQQLFKEQSTKQFESWRTAESVSTEDLYQFLHRVKGSGASIGLPLWSLQAELLLDDLHRAGGEHNRKQWAREELFAFLNPLLQVAVEGDGQPAETATGSLMTENVFVLLVTQQAAVVTEVKAELEGLGWSVIAMDSAARATRSFFRYKPDLLIVDDKLALDQTSEGRYLLQKVEEHGIGRVLIGEQVPDSATEQWDAVFERPLAWVSWMGTCKRLVRRRDLARQRMRESSLSIQILEQQWPHVKNWLGERAVLAYLDIERLREINELRGYAAGDEEMEKLASLLRERFPEAGVYHGSEDEFYLLLQADSPQQVQEDLLQACRALPWLTINVRVMPVLPNEEISLALRRLRDGNLFAAHAEMAATAEIVQTQYLAIIDDDEIVRSLLSEQFKLLPNLNIMSYREGESFFDDAWHKQDGQYLLIIDGMLPRMDGFEVVYKVRTQYDADKYSILMLTGRKSEKDIVRALELGVDDYITKPFGIRELEARVKRLFKRLER
ncbi:response regulator [Tumebacillus sp. ITR2]|uniref:Response regulator n=1 Tax=Tumebacillus amylolyticus TaxID=2801339 RepID=A0ABS1JGB6_9BACL|nr:response regulator [Tumebacillus amylolyticus]MBL0389044.1 response regulator [Tumebacillus amylolyticus]